MPKYIPKDVLLAEIERRMKLRYDSYKIHKTLSDFIVWEELEYFKEEFLPTLEVKEIDLNRELEDYIEKERAWIKDDRSVVYNNGDLFNYIYDLRKLAEHFFELGMQVSNPITAADRGTAEEIIINLKRVEQDYRIDLTKEIGWVRNKAQKGE